MPKSIGKAIRRERVSSRCLLGVGHNKQTKTLEVEFRNSGAVYRYAGVSAASATRLRKAKSIGRHFVKNIRNNYEYTRVRSGRSRSKRVKRHR